MAGLEQIENIFSQSSESAAVTNIDVWQTPFDVIHDDGLFKLIHYHNEKTTYKTPVIQVFSYINRPYILDLQPDVSVVRRLQGSCLDIYMIDWGYPQKIHRFINIEDYIDYIDFCVGVVKRETGAGQVTLHGYCLGGTLSIIYSALKPEKIKNLVVQMSPVDFDNDASKAFCAKNEGLENIIETSGCAPGDFLILGFPSVESIQKAAGKHSQNINKFVRVERWIHDCPAIPGAAYKRYSKEWCQENKLIKGKFKILNHKVDLARINMPTLVISAQRDRFVPPESTLPILDKITSPDRRHMTIDKKRVGLSVSTQAHKELWPEVCKWIADRS